jgi:hypothetical protein
MRIGSARAMVVLGIASVVISCAVVGCATGRPVVESLGPQRFHLKCTTELSRCLAEAADAACRGHHYIVERAVNDLNLRGSTPFQTEFRTSEAIIQCGDTNGWGPLGPPMGPPEKPPEEKAAEARVCAPGATQACVGTAGCKGGQSCLMNGSAYGLCDCGAPAPVPAPPSAPVADPTRPPS